uniref:Uncharacterized protein n=1 Tax=Glossina pallidipes TaxID=7398 RepID=A0A1B0AE61_GLOPL
MHRFMENYEPHTRTARKDILNEILSNLFTGGSLVTLSKCCSLVVKNFLVPYLYLFGGDTHLECGNTIDGGLNMGVGVCGGCSDAAAVSGCKNDLKRLTVEMHIFGLNATTLMLPKFVFSLTTDPLSVAELLTTVSKTSVNALARTYNANRVLELKPYFYGQEVK